MNAKPERLGDVDQAAAAATATSEFEGEIREFVRRDVASWRRPRSESPGEIASENINSLLQRVAGASVTEIDRVIAELETVRDMLRSEGDRVQREIAGYASMSQTAMASMKVIAESISQWKTPPAPVQSTDQPS